MHLKKLFRVSVDGDKAEKSTVPSKDRPLRSKTVLILMLTIVTAYSVAGEVILKLMERMRLFRWKNTRYHLLVAESTLTLGLVVLNA